MPLMRHPCHVLGWYVHAQAHNHADISYYKPFPHASKQTTSHIRTIRLGLNSTLLCILSFQSFFKTKVKKNTPVPWCLATTLLYVLVHYSTSTSTILVSLKVEKSFFELRKLKSSLSYKALVIYVGTGSWQNMCALAPAFLKRHNNKVSTDDVQSLFIRDATNRTMLPSLCKIIQLAQGPQKDRVSIVEREQTVTSRMVRGFGYSAARIPRCDIIIETKSIPYLGLKKAMVR